MSRKMPDWYINIMAEVGLEMEKAPAQHKNLGYWFQRMWEELSKPENAANICPNCKEELNEKNSEE